MTVIIGIQPTWRGGFDVDPKWTLIPHIRAYLASGVKMQTFSSRTARAKGYTLYPLAESFGRRPMNQLTATATNRWREDMSTCRDSTLRNRINTAKVFFDWLVADGKIKANPLRGVRIRVKPGPPKTLHHAEVAKLLAHVADDTRASAIAWLMIGCALRCIEVANLNVEDYDTKAKTLRVVGKFGKSRIVPVPAEVAPKLDAYLDEAGWQSGALIRRRYHPEYVYGIRNAMHNGRLQRQTISIYMQKWVREAGIKHHVLDGRSAHGLRRTCATDVMRNHKDIRIVKELLGHENLATTQAYLAHADLDEMRLAMSGRTYSPD